MHNFQLFYQLKAKWLVQINLIGKSTLRLLTLRIDSLPHQKNLIITQSPLKLLNFFLETLLTFSCFPHS